MTRGCNGCPPFVAFPCGQFDGFGTAWSQTGFAFAATKTLNAFPFTVSSTPTTGTQFGHAYPGQMQVNHHVDHLMLPATSSGISENISYDFRLDGVGPFDPDEFQIRGYIQARLDWTLATPFAAGQVDQSARVRFGVGIDDGSGAVGIGGPTCLVGIDFNRTRLRLVDTTGTPFWRADYSDVLAITIYYPNGARSSIVSISRPTDHDIVDAGMFVIDRSVTRGTTQLWLNNEMILEVANTAWGETDPIIGSFDFADLGVHTAGVPDLTMAEEEVELAMLRICPTGTAIFEPDPIRNQTVVNEWVGTGDGVTTAFATHYAYVPQSLQVHVSGILSESDSTDPANRVFTMPDPPTYGARVVATYTASGL